MNRPKLVRLLFILGPALLLTFQLFQEPSFDRPHKIQIALRALVPPMGFIYQYIDFNQKNALSKWEEKVFQGKVTYWIEFQNSSGFVHSLSKGTSSAIFYKIKYKIADYPFISWKWHVAKFPDKRNVTDLKKRDDFAARFYIVFLSKFFTNFRCVEYVWDESLKEGTMMESPYTNQIKQIVVQSGPSAPGEWILETRNVFEDYEKLFGEKPSMKVAAIAIMSDSEGTGTEAEAFFDDIRIGKSAAPHTKIKGVS